MILGGGVAARAVPGYDDVSVECAVPCRLSDGTMLLADVYRPAERESPVLLMRLPYNKTHAGANRGYPGATQLLAATRQPPSLRAIAPGFTSSQYWLDHPSYYLHSRGRANSAYGDGSLSVEPPAEEPADVYLCDPLMPNPSLGGHSCCAESIAPMGPADQEAFEALKTAVVATQAVFHATRYPSRLVLPVSADG